MRRNCRIAPLRKYYLPVAERKPQPNHNKSGALAWISDTIRSRGLFGALRCYAAGDVELLRDLAPARRKSRYGDIDYDFEHSVDTTWATVSLRTRLRELLSGGQYQPSEPVLFHEILNSMPVAVDGFTFVDLGSGKGRTLLMASEYPFRRIIGVEILVELNKIAQQNIVRYRSERQKCFAIEVTRLATPRSFEIPARSTRTLSVQSFSRISCCARCWQTSIAQSPLFRATIYVIYHNLVHENVFAEQEWLHPFIARTSLRSIERWFVAMAVETRYWSR